MTRPASTTHQTRTGRRVPIDQRRLPAAPLLEAVHSAARRRQEPLEELLGAVEGSRNPWLLVALRQAETSGAVTVLTGEHVCDLLGWHPRMVWGDTYDTTIADTTPHTAAAPPGTTSAWRQGCRCLDCRDANRAAIARSTTRRGSARKAGERLA
jgi:hypothetical protein